MAKTLKIGLTGGIGSGKSLVLSMLAKRGIPVLQTDQIGHELLKSKKVTQILVDRFGKTIQGEDKTVSRPQLARIVFKDSKKQSVLGKILHPLIRAEVASWVRNQEKKLRPAVVVEVPLLFENGYFRSFDGTICVSASRKLRQKRLLKRGWHLKEIRRREKFQWPQGRKNRKADWVIYNEGTRKNLKYSVDRWLDQVQSTGKSPQRFKSKK